MNHLTANMEFLKNINAKNISDKGFMEEQEDRFRVGLKDYFSEIKLNKKELNEIHSDITLGKYGMQFRYN